MARHLNREHNEHERAQVAFQLESGAMHAGDVDAPRQRGPSNERQHDEPLRHGFDLLWLGLLNGVGGGGAAEGPGWPALPAHASESWD